MAKIHYEFKYSYRVLVTVSRDQLAMIITSTSPAGGCLLDTRGCCQVILKKA